MFKRTCVAWWLRCWHLFHKSVGKLVQVCVCVLCVCVCVCVCLYIYIYIYIYIEYEWHVTMVTDDMWLWLSNATWFDFLRFEKKSGLDSHPQNILDHKNQIKNISMKFHSGTCDYLTLRSISSFNNPQNNEMKICEMKICENMKLTCWKSS